MVLKNWILYNFKHECLIKKFMEFIQKFKARNWGLLIITQTIFTKRKLKMEVERERKYY